MTPKSHPGCHHHPHVPPRVSLSPPCPPAVPATGGCSGVVHGVPVTPASHLGCYCPRRVPHRGSQSPPCPTAAPPQAARPRRPPRASPTRAPNPPGLSAEKGGFLLGGGGSSTPNPPHQPPEILPGPEGAAPPPPPSFPPLSVPGWSRKGTPRPPPSEGPVPEGWEPDAPTHRGETTPGGQVHPRALYWVGSSGGPPPAPVPPLFLPLSPPGSGKPPASPRSAGRRPP